MDEAQAEAQFVEVGGSCAAIRSQATAVDVTGTMPMKLSGPADVGVDQDPAASGCAEPAPEAEVEADEVEEIDGTTHEHILEGEDMPGLRCVAGEVGSDDLDVERVLKEFAAKLKLLMSRRGRFSKVGRVHVSSTTAGQTEQACRPDGSRRRCSGVGRWSEKCAGGAYWNGSFEYVQSRILAEMFPRDVSLW